MEKHPVVLLDPSLVCVLSSHLVLLVCNLKTHPEKCILQREENLNSL